MHNNITRIQFFFIFFIFFESSSLGQLLSLSLWVSFFWITVNAPALVERWLPLHNSQIQSPRLKSLCLSWVLGSISESSIVTRKMVYVDCPDLGHMAPPGNRKLVYPHTKMRPGGYSPEQTGILLGEGEKKKMQGKQKQQMSTKATFMRT